MASGCLNTHYPRLQHHDGMEWAWESKGQIHVFVWTLKSAAQAKPSRELPSLRKTVEGKREQAGGKTGE